MAQSPPADWRFPGTGWQLELRLTESGQVGVFPEQADNWGWLGKQIRAANERGRSPLRVLNLFAYTGASSLAVAAAGAAVTHVDAARGAVNWARRNAELSGLANAPIRWIVEDARRFVERELRRGRRYDAVVLDPPSYGHGPAGETWRFDEHLSDLLAACGELTTGEPNFMLLTCHSPGIGPREARELLAAALQGVSGATIEAAPLELKCRAGRRLNAGVMARYAASWASNNA
jgi:23S rRNA (cytosine1962-C5)-methyltransferase